MDAHHHGTVPSLAPLGTAAARTVVTPTSDNAHLAVGEVEGQGATDTPIFEQLAEDAQAVLSQGPNGHWLMSGWNDGAGRLGVVAPGGGPVVHSGSTYLPDPSVIQNQAGAGATAILRAPGEVFHPDMAQALRAVAAFVRQVGGAA